VLDRLGDNSIFCAVNDAALAIDIAKDFPEPKEDVEPPALGLCDEELFNALAGSLSDKGIELHNPEKHRLAASSLGRIALILVALRDCGGGPYPWDGFSALMREDDVLSFLTRYDGAPWRVSILKGMDIFRNANLPVDVPPGGFPGPGLAGRGGDPEKDFDRKDAEAFAAASRTLAGYLASVCGNSANAAAFVRAALSGLYGRRTIGGNEGDREFEAALETLHDVLGDFSSGAVGAFGLPDSMLSALLRKRISDAVYSLEPDSEQALMTEGWLELQWSAKERIVLAGFREGAVPESVDGHVFLPDSLRAALGLPTNTHRLARDAFLLSGLLESRKRGDVHVFFSRSNDAGEIRRPSRLLFFVGDAAGADGPPPLVRRVGLLFGGVSSGTASSHPRRVADAWRPDFGSDVPTALPGETDNPPCPPLSASRIDRWLLCPFTYFLENVLEMQRVEEKDELGANDFGTIAHDILQRYAEEQIDRTLAGRAQLANVGEIGKSLDGIFANVSARYGKAPGLKVRLQLEAIRERLKLFASLQETWAIEGWRIAAAEYEFTARPFEGKGTADVMIHGFIDRIDFNEKTGKCRVIDYKTWDDPGKAAVHILKGGEAQLAHAKQFGLPTTTEPTSRGEPKSRRFLSVQLPLYARCVERQHEHPARPGKEAIPAKGFAGGVAELCYVVLGKNGLAVFGNTTTPSEFTASRNIDLSKFRDIAEKTAQKAIERIRAGFFWPPGPDKTWKRDFGGLFVLSPEKDLSGTPWLDGQLRCLMAPVAAADDKEAQS
jgi:ATP-dependent helicase/nuclease subunit B